MKLSTIGLLVLSIIWIAVSLLWFLWLRSPIVGCVWLCAGIAALMLSIVRRSRERRKG